MRLRRVATRVAIVIAFASVVVPVAGSGASASAVDTRVANPDGYQCSQRGFIDFESFPDLTNLSATTFSGVHFTTTNGYTWQVGDFATGHYNGKYPSGAYTSQGTHWAWLGASQGAGRIDFTDGPAAHLSVLVSANTPVELEGYRADGTLLETAGPVSSNIWTGAMDELRIDRPSADLAYALIHDSGNFFTVDSLCTDAPNVSGHGGHGNWVALGDSYSSGEGNPPFDAGTDVFNHRFFGGDLRMDGCHRSADAWPRLLGVQSHFACSGAKINNLFNGQERLAPDNDGQIARLRHVELSLQRSGQHVGLVTLTIGGNDLGFANILGDCFIRECLAHPEVNAARLQFIGPELRGALAAIKVAAPSAKVVLVGYPRLFPGSQSGNTRCGWLTPTERIRANTLFDGLEATLSTTAKQAGVTFVSVKDALSGHELCTTNSWVTEVNPLQNGSDQKQGHPTLSGQQAIAAVVNANL